MPVNFDVLWEDYKQHDQPFAQNVQWEFCIGTVMHHLKIYREGRVGSQSIAKFAKTNTWNMNCINASCPSFKFVTFKPKGIQYGLRTDNLSQLHKTNTLGYGNNTSLSRGTILWNTSYDTTKFAQSTKPLKIWLRAGKQIPAIAKSADDVYVIWDV